MNYEIKVNVITVSHMLKFTTGKFISQLLNLLTYTCSHGVQRFVSFCYECFVDQIVNYPVLYLYNCKSSVVEMLRPMQVLHFTIRKLQFAPLEF